MAFMEDFGKKISQSGQNAVQKAKDMADISKINSLISDEERKIRSIYLQIGKQYFDKYGAECEEDFAARVNSIIESKEKIESYQSQINEIKGLVRCSKCKGFVDKNAAFCSLCGEALVKPVPENKKRCGKCGELMDKSVKFCTKCGNPLPSGEQPIPEPVDEQPMPETVIEQPMPETVIEQPMPEIVGEQPEQEAVPAGPRRCECGAIISNDTQRFCVKCGKPLQPAEQPMQKAVPAGPRRCECGAIISNDTQRFCVKCGRKL